jgi:hypothetical protein
VLVPSNGGSRRMARMLVVAGALSFTGAACSSGPSAADIAKESCDLARRAAAGTAGAASVLLEANDIRRKASANNIGFSDVLSEARRACPDVIDLLGF